MVLLATPIVLVCLGHSPQGSAAAGKDNMARLPQQGRGTRDVNKVFRETNPTSLIPHMKTCEQVLALTPTLKPKDFFWTVNKLLPFCAVKTFCTYIK